MSGLVRAGGAAGYEGRNESLLMDTRMPDPPKTRLGMALFDGDVCLTDKSG